MRRLRSVHSYPLRDRWPSTSLHAQREVVVHRTPTRLRPGDDGGFSLVELIVVLLVIAVILTIAIPTFGSLTSAPKVQSPEQSLKTALAAANTYFVEDNFNYEYLDYPAQATVPTINVTVPNISFTSAGASFTQAKATKGISTGPNIVSISNNVALVSCPNGGAYCLNDPNTSSTGPGSFISTFYGDLILAASTADQSRCYVIWSVPNDESGPTSYVKYGFFHQSSSTPCAAGVNALLATPNFQQGNFPGATNSAATSTEKCPPLYGTTTTIPVASPPCVQSS